tara:strand:+ start:1036 stop:1428 length:393 start_codon:yes stop_codon:yes gene_type:complete
MSSGLSVKLPLTVSNVFGPYDLNTTYDELAKQNLKMLILTHPGERIMHPEFGLGLSKYLFENNTPDTYGDIASQISSQTQIYLPYIHIDNVDFSSPENNPGLFPYSLTVSIKFTIIPLQQSDVLQITISN